MEKLKNGSFVMAVIWIAIYLCATCFERSISGPSLLIAGAEAAALFLLLRFVFGRKRTLGYIAVAMLLVQTPYFLRWMIRPVCGYVWMLVPVLIMEAVALLWLWAPKKKAIAVIILALTCLVALYALVWGCLHFRDAWFVRDASMFRYAYDEYWATGERMEPFVAQRCDALRWFAVACFNLSMALAALWQMLRGKTPAPAEGIISAPGLPVEVYFRPNDPADADDMTRADG